MSEQQNYTIESLDTGLRLLQLFLTHDRLTVTQAARLLGVARSTAHRVLSTMVARSFVTRDASGRGYAAGPELVHLGRPAGFDSGTRERLAPVLDEALARTGETIQVLVLLGDQVTVVAGRESSKATRARLEIGETHPAYATSGGKVLLAQLTVEQIEALYREEQLPTLTPHTVATRTELVAQLAQVRARGYAVSRGESAWGMHAVAVPLAGTSWRDRMALMGSAPADRGDEAALAERAEQLHAAARLLSR